MHKKQNDDKKNKSSSWESVQHWYNKSVGKEGHYYHQQVILPGILRLLNLKNTSEASLLDIGCGQGVLARHIPEHVSYLGIDLSPSLIKEAKIQDHSKKHEYLLADATHPLSIKDKTFSHATAILSLQNMEYPDKVFQNAAKLLKKEGIFIFVLNHPCFRIPRQSSWGIDEQKQIQYRRLDRYLSEMKVPIQSAPSKGEKSSNTWSFHHSLSSYTEWLNQAGFCIVKMEEWCSDKVSTGKAAAMENRARDEFPLFLTIIAKKTN